MIKKKEIQFNGRKRKKHSSSVLVQRLGGGRGYDDSVPGVVVKTAPSVDRTA